MSLLLALGFASLVAAADNGMDMSMDGGMSLAAGKMVPYLHFSPGDMLWFQGWVPQSPGAMVGACIGLALLGIVERWIVACSAVMSAHWAKRARVLQTTRNKAKGLPTDSVQSLDSPSSSSVTESTRAPLASTRTVLTNAITMRTIPPFIASHEFIRGIIYGGRASLQFAFMLVVMTFQASFIVSLAVGLGIGETLFGRYYISATHIV